MSKPDNLDTSEESRVLPSPEEVLMNEDELLKGLLEASNFKIDKSLQKKIQIRRGGKLLFEFTVRPLEQAEITACRKKATKFMPNPAGIKYPRIEGETDYPKYYSYKILAATLPEDYKKIWGRRELKDRFNTLEDVDVVDNLLLAGEKSHIDDIIDQISGWGVNEDITAEEYAKN